MATPATLPPVSQIRSLAEALIDPEAFHSERRSAAHSLFDALSAIAGFDDQAPTAGEIKDTWVDGGRAISPREAARCLREYLRSHKFMLGVQQAIAAAQKRFPGQTIEVLYAGTGPFASLVIPLAHRWPPEGVQYTLLDIHETSLSEAKRIAKHLQVEDRVRRWQLDNAVTYQCPEGYQPHLLVTETMQQGLRDETQVAISRNLVPQLHPDGILVPEEIELFSTFSGGIEIQTGSPTEAHPQLGTVMRLNQANAAEGGECYCIDWPVEPPANSTPMLNTRIQVFGDNVLRHRDCSLNIPTVLPVPSSPPQARLCFEYRTHPKPGLFSQWEGEHLSTLDSGIFSPGKRYGKNGPPRVSRI